jgi:polysaccharide biosynthesis/export protein
MIASSFTKLIGVLFCLIIFASCDPNRRINRDYQYFQHDRDVVVKENIDDLTIKPYDQLSIQIYSNTTNQEQTAIFNLTANQGYVVSPEGQIELPILGRISVGGQTREQLQKNLLVQLQPHVKNPGVQVRFLNFKILVLGEVASPGAKTFPTDKVTILDAISLSGDLAPTGRRDNVTVIRENNGVRQFYEIDLRSAAIFESPVYQLQQNDIVYINANKTKLKAVREEKVNIGQILQTGVSIIGVATSLYLLFRNN